MMVGPVFHGTNSSSRNEVIAHLYEVNDSVFIAIALLNSKQKI